MGKVFLNPFKTGIAQITRSTIPEEGVWKHRAKIIMTVRI